VSLDPRLEQAARSIDLPVSPIDELYRR